MLNDVSARLTREFYGAIRRKGIDDEDLSCERCDRANHSLDVDFLIVREDNNGQVSHLRYLTSLAVLRVRISLKKFVAQERKSRVTPGKRTWFPKRNATDSRKACVDTPLNPKIFVGSRMWSGSVVCPA